MADEDEAGTPMFPGMPAPGTTVRCSRCGEMCVEMKGMPWEDRWVCPKDQVPHFKDGRPGQN